MPVTAVVNQGERITDVIGLENGPHQIIKCSACGKKLVDVWRTQPNETDPRTGKPFEWKIQAHCCFCGDTSFIETVKGAFHWGGIGETKVDDAEDSVMHTVIDDTKDDEKGVIHVYTKKAKI